jgi:zinc transport system substrate-binding protein
MRWINATSWMALVTVAGIVGLVSPGCSSPSESNPWQKLPGPPRVVASFAPLACFAMNVGGGDAGVLTICAAKGPHGYEPTPEDQQKLRQADVFFVNGLELDERFADKMAQASGNPRLVGKDAPGFVEVGERLLKARLVDKMGEHDHHDHEGRKEEEAKGDEHHHGEQDPHVWLGSPQAEAMVNVIRDELKTIDGKHASDYDRQAADYIEKLKKLHADGKQALADKKNRKIVTTHDSLHYFAESFGLEIAGVIELQPGTEPDAATMQELVKKCKKEGARVIATEPQYRQKMAETLSAELKRQGMSDVEIIDVDPLETVTTGETLDRGWYERRMRANIEELKKALR